MRRSLCWLVIGLSSSVSGWILSRRKLVIGTAGTAAFFGGAAAASAAAAVLKDSQKNKELYTPAPGSLEGQTIVITGGTTGLGLESAERLAVGGAKIIITARTEAKGEAALDKLRSYLEEKGLETKNVSYKVVDFDNLKTVKEIPKSWEDVGKIDVLMNNAGVMAIPELQLTVDGYEKQMQSNHLGHFTMTALLASKLSPQARIINVSSDAHKFAGNGLLSQEALWKPEPNDYGSWKSYGQSKLANLLFTQELQRRSQAAGLDWTVTSLHPGAVSTDLGRYLYGEKAWNDLKEGKGTLPQVALAKALSAFIKTVPEGATTQIWLAAKADPTEDVRSKYYVDCKARPLSDFATDPKAAERLWRESEERAGIEFKL